MKNKKPAPFFFNKFQTKIQKPCIQHINNYGVLSLA